MTATPIMTLPNWITSARLVLTVVLCALMSVAWADATSARAAAWVVLILFLVAALSDVLDGYLARKLNQVTAFGRIFDPFVDKLLVCGIFTLLIGVPLTPGEPPLRVEAWMVVLIVGRELLVSSIRADAEEAGVAFGADWSGKLKMAAQSVCLAALLLQLAMPTRIFEPLLRPLLYATVAITVWSLFAYLHRARTRLFSAEALAGVKRSNA